MNILLLSSVYKDESLGEKDKSTNVINSFAREWVKQGHKVTVIHNAHRYPVVIHKLPYSFREKLAVHLGFFIGDLVSERHYNDHGVDVWRLPFLKTIPHRGINREKTKRQVKKIEKILSTLNFEPNVIVGHWASPQLEIVSELKKVHNCKTAIILHGTDYIDQKHYKAKEYLRYIDKLGCRSKTQAEKTKEILQLNEMPFVCYSGIPDEYINNLELITEKFENIHKWRFAYVGRLVGYKRVDVIIQALNELDIEWQFDIVGEGAERDHLEKICSHLKCEDKVIFHGRVPRDKVMKMLEETHCFIMVSKGEVFGLVYLEAMAASCISIGSIREGIDGIIIDGENGFLCKPADIEALKSKLKMVTTLNYGELSEVVKNGYETAKCFSDSKVAKKYLEEIV